MPYVYRHKDVAGFTLVELMIAMVLGLIVAGGASALFVSQRVANKQSSGMATIQNEGRIALDALVRDIRGGGDYGCWPVGTHTQTVVDTNRFNPENGGVYAFYRGSKPDSTGYTYDGKNTLPLLGADEVAKYDLDADSDIVALRGVYGMLSELKTSMVAATDPLNVSLPTSGQDIRQGDALVVTDCRNSSIFEVTGGDNAALQHIVANKTGLMGNGNTKPGLGAIYQSGAVVGRLDVVWWFVATINGKKGLYRLSYRDLVQGTAAGTDVSPLLVSDSVQTLHLNFTYNTQSDSSKPEVLAKGNAATINAAIKAGTLVRSWSAMRSVEVSLLAKSAKPGNAVPVPYTFDGVQKTPTDHYLYLPLTMTTGLRNTL